MKSKDTISKKKVAQITWINYRNYGTFLQGYALQNVIRSLGYDTKIIDDNRYIKRNWKYYVGSFLHIVLHPIGYLQLIQRKKKFIDFADRYLSIDTNCKSNEAIDTHYDIMVCGSDQIWSVNLPDHHNGYYFLSWTNKPKISYAPSLGGSEASEIFQSQLYDWIKDFKAVSVREEEGAKIVRNSGITDVTVVADPTLLLSADDWDKVANNPQIDSPYILLYLLTYNKKYCEFARKEASSKGKKLVILYTGIEGLKQFADITVVPGPSEFIGLIKNADSVITDSFHGTIFSIIYKKTFVSLLRFSSDSKNNQNSRIYNLGKKLNVTSNIYSESDLKKGFPARPDYVKVSKLISDLKEYSIDFLKNALKYG